MCFLFQVAKLLNSPETAKLVALKTAPPSFVACQMGCCRCAYIGGQGIQGEKSAISVF